MIKLVVLDLDMTIIDTLRRFHRMFNIALEKFGGRKIDWEHFLKDYKRMMSLGGFSLRGLPLLIKYYPVPIHKEVFWQYFRRLWNIKALANEDRLIEGAYEALKFLKENDIKAGIITGRIVPPESVWEELKKFNIAEFMYFVYTFQEGYEKGGKRKDLLLRALKETKVEKSEVMMVGDQIPDMVSAKEVGVTAVGVLTGLISERILRKHGADIILESVKDIPKVIEKMNN